MKFRKRPVVIEATQWFKNGDHPLDYSKDHQGFEAGELRTFAAAERKANAWEGDIVRYFRRPDVPGKQACKHCSVTRLHKERDAYRAEYNSARDANQRLASELAAYKKAKAENDDRYMTERDEARRALAVSQGEVERLQRHVTLAIDSAAAATRSLGEAVALVRRLFANTRHFPDCLCVTCELARAFLAGAAPPAAPVVPEGTGER